ncbi:glycosyltransferase family 4 protein [Georgenia muralis]
MRVTRVLWLSNETPDKAGQGGQRRQYFLIKTLVAGGHDVTVATLAGAQSSASVAALTRTIRFRTHWRGRLPAVVLRTRLRRLVSSRRWDAIVVAHTESWPTVRKALRGTTTPVLLDMHNVLSEWFRTQGRIAESARWRQVEAEIAANVEVVAVCAPRDIEYLPAAPPGGIIVVPHGVAPSEWRCRAEPAGTGIVKTFGNWGWPPNRSGMRWFLEEVWPRILDRAPHMCFQAAGSDFPVGLQAPGVEFVGRVMSVAEFLRSADVVVVPVRDGVGAPLKFAEAVVSGVPVVATTEAAHGSTAEAWRISNDPDEWAAVICRAVTAPADARSHARRARDTALNALGWDVVSAPLVQWVEAASAQHRVIRHRSSSTRMGQPSDVLDLDSRPSGQPSGRENGWPVN